MHTDNHHGGSGRCLRTGSHACTLVTFQKPHTECWGRSNTGGRGRTGKASAVFRADVWLWRAGSDSRFQTTVGFKCRRERGLPLLVCSRHSLPPASPRQSRRRRSHKQLISVVKAMAAAGRKVKKRLELRGKCGLPDHPHPRQKCLASEKGHVPAPPVSIQWTPPAEAPGVRHVYLPGSHRPWKVDPGRRLPAEREPQRPLPALTGSSECAFFAQPRVRLGAASAESGRGRRPAVRCGWAGAQCPVNHAAHSNRGAAGSHPDALSEGHVSSA